MDKEYRYCYEGQWVYIDKVLTEVKRPGEYWIDRDQARTR
jgi:hypothetical protein